MLSCDLSSQLLLTRSEEHFWGTSTSGGWSVHTSVRQQAVIVPFLFSMLPSFSLCIQLSIYYYRWKTLSGYYQGKYVCPCCIVYILWKVAAKISLLYAFWDLAVATSMQMFLCAMSTPSVVGSCILEEISPCSVKSEWCRVTALSEYFLHSIGVFLALYWSSGTNFALILVLTLD